jgi:hypothetical protein
MLSGEAAMSDTILCPKCKSQIEVSAALSAQIKNELQGEMEAALRPEKENLAKFETEIRQREYALDQAWSSLEKEVSKRLAEQQERLQMEAKTKAEQLIAVDLLDLQSQLAQTKEKLGLAQQTELQLRKERREIEDQKQEVELAISRTLDEERTKIREDARRETVEENRLREADKEKLIGALRHQIDELKRKSEQGSQQSQGEVLELELEDLLGQAFPIDTLEPLAQGLQGGDILQHVHDAGGQLCGTILWESKRTKNWSDAWLPKLRDDQRSVKAHFAALLTIEMPKGLNTFGCVGGVWVTSRSCLIGMATALRACLIEVARSLRSADGRLTKADLVYQYLAGPEFRQRIEGIVEAFVTLKNDLDSEKRSLQRQWAKREKQLERAVNQTAGLYGDLGGILGATLPQLANLELPNGELEPPFPQFEPSSPLLDSIF